MLPSFWGSSPKLLFESEEIAFDRFKNSVDINFETLKKYGIFFSLTTDPLLDGTKNLTYKSTLYCLDRNIPVKILTKCAGWETDSFIQDIGDDKKHLIYFGVSLSGRDDLEMGAPSNDERINLLKTLYNKGFRVFLSAEPIIDIHSTIGILKKVKDYIYMARFNLLTPGKYNKISAEYQKEDLLIIYDWVN